MEVGSLQSPEVQSPKVQSLQFESCWVKSRSPKLEVHWKRFSICPYMLNDITANALLVMLTIRYTTNIKQDEVGQYAKQYSIPIYVNCTFSDISKSIVTVFCLH